MNFRMRLFQRKTNGVWYAEFPGGKRRTLGKEVKTEREAKKLFEILRREYYAGRLADITGECRITLGVYAGEFLEWSEQVQPRSTFKANRLALNKLRYYAGESCALDRISPKHVDQMVKDARKEKLTTASINNYIRHMRASLNKAVEWKYVKENPLNGIREIPSDKAPPMFMDKADIAKFLSGIHDIDLRRMAIAYLCTGRRRSEILNLEWKDIDLESGRYFVKNPKGSRSRWFPINGMFAAVLSSMSTDHGDRIFHRWSHPDTISHYIKTALTEAGLGHLHLHHLRHTFASLQVMQGRTLYEVQQLLGHSQQSTTQIYAHLSDEHIRSAAEINLGPVDLGLHGQKADSKQEGRV